jgi:drug/metabolite transporter (DMT)-like permease
MWGFTGILGKLIHLDPLPIVWYRVLIAFFALLVFMWIARKETLVGDRKVLALILLTGIVVALHWYTFYMAIQLSTASLGILCLSTTTIHVAWLEPLIMRRPFSWLEMGLGVFVMFGIYYVSGDFNANEYLALAYGLGSAFLAALFAVINARLVTFTSASKITLYEMLAATIFLSLVLILQEDFAFAALSLTTSDFLWLLFLGVLCTSFAFLATIDVVKKLGAFTVS